jgi:hypothetical protein
MRALGELAMISQRVTVCEQALETSFFIEQLSIETIYAIEHVFIVANVFGALLWLTLYT